VIKDVIMMGAVIITMAQAAKKYLQQKSRLGEAQGKNVLIT
jgi:hypothetical protein